MIKTPQLHYFPLCPYSNLIRLLLQEKHIFFEARSYSSYKFPVSLEKYNPHQTWPIFIDDACVLSEPCVITEYIEEKYPTNYKLLGTDRLERNKIRSLEMWFCRTFYQDIILNIVYERVYKSFLASNISPDSNKIRLASNKLSSYLDLMEIYLRQHNFLATRKLSMADLAAGAHIACVDFLGLIKWHERKELKLWYYRIKSRPSFKSLLQDQIPNFPSVPHYKELDF